MTAAIIDFVARHQAQKASTPKQKPSVTEQIEQMESERDRHLAEAELIRKEIAEREYLAALHAKWMSPALQALPFYAPALLDCADYEDFKKRVGFWEDVKGDVGAYNRGRGYAREALTAILKDDAMSHGLNKMVESMICRGFMRRGPGGRPRRKLSSSEKGFLQGLCEVAAEATKQCRGLPTTLPPLF